jgi:hypothetical protein
MIVQHDNFADSSWVLQLQHRLLLHTQDDDVLAAYSDLKMGQETKHVRLVLRRIDGGLPRMCPS